MTSGSGPQADRSGRSQGFRLRERAACLQLVGFHLFYEGDGPRQRILRNHISVESRSPPYAPAMRLAQDRRTPIVRSPQASRQVAVAVELAAFSELDLGDRASDNAIKWPRTSFAPSSTGSVRACRPSSKRTSAAWPTRTTRRSRKRVESPKQMRNRNGRRSWTRSEPGGARVSNPKWRRCERRRSD